MHGDTMSNSSICPKKSASFALAVGLARAYCIYSNDTKLFRNNHVTVTAMVRTKLSALPFAPLPDPQKRNSGATHVSHLREGTQVGRQPPPSKDTQRHLGNAITLCLWKLHNLTCVEIWANVFPAV